MGLGKRPEDPHCECDWDLPLFSSGKQLAAKEDTSGAYPPLAATPSTGCCTPEVTSAEQSSTTDQISGPVHKGGFVAELPKLRRPIGEPGAGRPMRKGVVTIA